MATEAEAIHAENRRKTRELEDARRLQLSMLPESVPELPDCEIAVCMHPATEVGGDYFDFGESKDGSLVVAVGDPTGHGTRAGIMVAVMKGLFSTLGEDPDLTGFLSQCHRILRNMNLESMRMAMTLIHLQQGRVRATVAAMPPVFLFRSASGKVETIPVGGMFLGSCISLPYEEVSFDLSPGDVILLRDTVGLTGSHIGCEHGVCGACTVRVDGEIVRGCLMLAAQANGRKVDTIEGLSDSGEIADLQDAFHERNALQCGFCTPGMLMSAWALLQRDADPSREAIAAGLSGNLCRCTGYTKIFEAVELAARELRERSARSAT